MKYWTRTNLPVGEVRRRAMQYFGKEALSQMALVTREPSRLLFSDPFGDLVVRVDAGHPNVVSVVTSHWPAEAQDFLQRRTESIEGVIHYEVETDRSPQEILSRAREYFGQTAQGLGLSLAAEQAERIEFAGGGGWVTVGLHTDGQATLDVAAREWTYHAEQFARQLSSEH